jgi:transcriptional regulator with XRE-family HTH domain
MAEQTAVRFPDRLQQSRLQHGWKQATLAEALGVKRRTLISWEAGERLPPVGMVVRLSTLLQTDLLTPYITDDLLRQYGESMPHEYPSLPADLAAFLQEHGASGTQESEQLRSASETPTNRFTVLRPEETSASQAPTDLADLFALLTLLHAQPALIRVALDFLKEMTTDQNAEAS